MPLQTSLCFTGQVCLRRQTWLFKPNDPITRAKRRDHLRIALPSERKTFELVPVSEELGILNGAGKQGFAMGRYVYLQECGYTAEELLELKDLAALHLRSGFEIKLTKDVYDDYIAYLEIDDNAVGYGDIRTTYIDTTCDFTYEIEYNLYHQIFGLIYNRSMVEPYVSREALEYDAQMRSILDKIITSTMTDRQKIKAVHDYMVVNYKYDTDIDSGKYGTDSYMFYGLLKNNTGVCQAYADLFYLLCAMRISNVIS